MASARAVRGTSRFVVAALMTAIAYVDPGNFGVNLAAGASYGHALVWVVVGASLTATLIQYLAAKLGAASGAGLARDTADRAPRVVRLLAWAQAEVVVIMTDLAELVGGAIALNLLVGLPLPLGALVVAIASVAVLGLRRTGLGVVSVVVITLLGVIVVATGAQLTLLHLGAAEPATAPLALDADAVLLAVGIIGATVMPHALHFHSALSVAPGGGAPSRARPLTQTPGLRPARIALVVAAAMVLAAATNVALLLVGARLPQEAAADLGSAATAIGVAGGDLARILFGVALLASGLAATVVGGYTGQIVMDAFWRRPIPIWVRRLIGVAVPLIILLAGLDATRALVISQVVLSFCLPGTLAPLVVMTAQRSVMGSYVNRRSTTVLAAAATLAITAMDVVLIAVIV